MNRLSIIFFLILVTTLTMSNIVIADNNNYIDNSYANIEGNNIQIQQTSPFLNKYEIDYIVKNSKSNFIIDFSSNAKPIESSINPLVTCHEVTSPIFIIFVKLNGYSCNFGKVEAGNKIHIEFQNTATPLTKTFNMFGV
ncbi:MAG: hypothetical protein PHU12_00925 [Candidatus Aenigmarchaeota archaeon]|nr:hypothetical protein [Candidatus Aenigmarchaeota archaeon]